MKPAPKIVAASEKIYEKLLRLYPQPYRRDFGAQMAQLFRDQCRDAWQAGRSTGLIKLWLHTLPDLGKTSLIEQLNHIERNHIMNAKHTPTVLLIAGLTLALLSFSHFVMPFRGVFMLLLIGSSLAILAKAGVELFRPPNELPAILIRTFVLMFFYALFMPAWAKLKMHTAMATPLGPNDPFGLFLTACLGANPVVTAIKLAQFFIQRRKS